MLSLSRKVDYALVALSHLLENQEQITSARAIAESHNLPLPLMMQILKRLHQSGILHSTRGVRGGYGIARNLDEVSLVQLISVVEGSENCDAPVARRLSLQAPVQALQYKLIHFLENVALSDLLKPGRRIDVPIDRVRVPARSQLCP